MGPDRNLDPFSQIEPEINGRYGTGLSSLNHPARCNRGGIISLHELCRWTFAAPVGVSLCGCCDHRQKRAGAVTGPATFAWFADRAIWRISLLPDRKSTRLN